MDNFFQDLTINRFKETYNWDKQSINKVIAQTPLLDRNLLYRCYDYFYALFIQNQLERKHLNQIGNAIEKALRAKEILTLSQIELLQQAANILIPKNPKTALQLFNILKPALPYTSITHKKIKKLEKQLSKKSRLPHLLNWFSKRTGKAKVESV